MSVPSGVDEAVGYPALAARRSDTDVFAFQASDYLSPEDLLKNEVEDSQRKLKVAVDTLNFFKQVFQDRRENLHTYFKEKQETRGWDFQSSLVFVRLDGFLRRLRVLQVSVPILLGLPGPHRSERPGIRGAQGKRPTRRGSQSTLL